MPGEPRETKKTDEKDIKNSLVHKTMESRERNETAMIVRNGRRKKMQVKMMRIGKYF